MSKRKMMHAGGAAGACVPRLEQGEGTYSAGVHQTAGRRGRHCVSRKAFSVRCCGSSEDHSSFLIARPQAKRHCLAALRRRRTKNDSGVKLFVRSQTKSLTLLDPASSHEPHHPPFVMSSVWSLFHRRVHRPIVGPYTVAPRLLAAPSVLLNSSAPGVLGISTSTAGSAMRLFNRRSLCSADPYVHPGRCQQASVLLRALILHPPLCKRPRGYSVLTSLSST